MKEELEVSWELGQPCSPRAQGEDTQTSGVTNDRREEAALWIPLISLCSLPLRVADTP